MQAIILAAGMGKRLGELTADNTKCMIDVNGVKLIDRMLGQLAARHLRRIVIVVGYKADNLTQHIRTHYKGDVPVEFVHNPIYDKTNNIYSMTLAKEKLQEDDTLLLESDLIFEDRMLSLLLDNPLPDLALVAPYETWMDGTMVRIDEDNNIVSFIPKKAFKYTDTPHYYKTCNIYKFSRGFSQNQYVPFLEAYSRAMGDNEYYEQVLRVITALDKSALKALPISGGKWYEIDDQQDKDIAEALFATDDKRLSDYASRFGGYWRFPQLKDFCYLVNPYFPTPRMKDELKANFDTLLTEYPSGMKVNALLGGKYFGIRKEYVCMGNGAAELIKCLTENHLKGKTGIIFPTFEEYPNRMDRDRTVAFVPDNADFRYTAADLEKYYEDKEIQSLLLINPDNPSGNCLGKSEMLALIDWTGRRGIRLVIDESFADFSTDFPDNSLLVNDILSDNPHLAVIKSISKSYGVPGLRLGILASSDSSLISALRKEVAIWNINSFAEFYMQIFNKHAADYHTACRQLVSSREELMNGLEKIHFLRPVPSQANYILCEVTGGVTSHELTRRLLLEHDILIKDCGTKAAFNGRNYVRIAVRDKEDNRHLIHCLSSL